MTTVPEPGTPSPRTLPVELSVVEDLGRSRLTVFFRLLLAIPHLLWLALWTVAVILLASVAWLVALLRGRLPDGLHRFFTIYVRYATHVYAYLNLAANPFPGFTGAPGYEIGLDFEPPRRQSRWTIGFRLVLALPALMLSAALGGSVGDGAGTYGLQATGVLSTAALLTWFYALATGRAPEGVARLQWYCLHYTAQASAYLLLVTERYPTSDPERIGVPWPAPEHPVALRTEPDGGTRSRLTVFFRLLLAFPHFVWLVLWSLAVAVVAFVNWVATLVRGRSPEPLHRFLAAYTRYQTHVLAFVTLVANPFPGFAGAAGSYPVDVAIDPPQPQGRWEVGFRLVLAIPAFILNSAIGTTLYLVGFLGWFASLVTGHMPSGLRRLGLFALRYNAQANAYSYGLLTSRYPYAGPPA